MGAAARYSSNPGIQHWNALKHILRYLRGTMDKSITYGRKVPDVEFAPLVGFVDSSWGDSPDDLNATVLEKAPLGCWRRCALVRRRTQLIEKGVTRPRRKIAPRLPAGSTVLAGVPKGRDFMRTKKSGGGAVQKQIDKYTARRCAARPRRSRTATARRRRPPNTTCTSGS